MTQRKVNFNTMRSVFFFGLIFILSIGMLYIVGPFLYPIFWAAVIAVMFYPVYEWLLKHTKMKRTSSMISIFCVLALIMLPLFLISILLIDQSIQLARNVLSYDFIAALAQAQDRIEAIPIIGSYVVIAWQYLIDNLAQAAQHITGFLLKNAQIFVGSSLRFLVMFFIMLYTLFYFFTDGPSILKKLMHLSPLGDKYEAMLYKRFTSTTRATLKSTLIIGGIQGILGGLLFWIAGVQSAFVWGVIMVIVAIIPAIGPSLVLFPAAIIMFGMGSMGSALWLFIGGLVISMVDNLLRPPLVGKDTQMHPLIVLFATLGGIILFGISGFVIGPIIAALFLSIMSIYSFYYKNELNNN